MLFEKIKNLFGGHGSKEGNETAAASEKKEKAVVTLDALADSIDGCKASLLRCGLSNEDTEKYSTALTAMQQAIRGLHPTLDASDLYEYLHQVFSTALIMIFSGGTPLERDKAVKTVNESIKKIPSTAETEIRVATLQLAILTQNALIISNRRIIDDLKVESGEYEAAEKEIIENSNAVSIDELPESEKRTFEQYQMQINDINAQIASAERLVLE